MVPILPNGTDRMWRGQGAERRRVRAVRRPREGESSPAVWKDVCMPVPHLRRLDPSGRPIGLVLMLHGGQPDSFDPVDGRSTSWLRSRWMQNQLAGLARAQGVGLWLLRYQHRGWNAAAGPHPSPVPDARWALDEVRRELGELPVVLLGHSMGARTAAAVADDP